MTYLTIPAHIGSWFCVRFPTVYLFFISSVEFAGNQSSANNIWRCTPSANILLSLNLAGRLHILLTNIKVLTLQPSTTALSIYVYKRMARKKIIVRPISKAKALRTDLEEENESPTQHCSWPFGLSGQLVSFVAVIWGVTKRSPHQRGVAWITAAKETSQCNKYC